MADKGAHPGVKSLLARFENSQQSVASPPPRDRSPAGPENLSKVRASFVAVEGGVPGSPVLGLRRISPHSETPSSPSRARSFGSDDLDGSIKSNGSSAQPTNGFGSPPNVNATENKDTIHDAIETKGKERVEEITSENKENHPTPKSPTVAPSLSTAKPTKTVSKKPSNIHDGKTTASANKPVSQAPISKTSAQSRTQTSANKPDNEKTAKVARVARPPMTASGKNDSQKSSGHRPSRSVTTTTKTSTRPARASTPGREATKPTARTNNVRSASTTRLARQPNSATTSSLTSGAKLSTNGGATSTLSRKPSSLKSTSAGTRQRTITPTTSSVRKQASSRSPPVLSPNNRSHSRASTASKPVDEGFLARMMRPTASSASKTHEKVEARSPPQSKVARVPRRVPSKLETRPAPPTKEKVVPKKSTEPEQHPASESAEMLPEREQKADPVQKIAEQPKPELSVEPSSQAPGPLVDEKPNEEATAEPLAESAANPVIEPADSQPNNTSDVALAAQPEETPSELVTGSATQKSNDQAEAGEAPVEPAPAILKEKVLAPAAEIVERTTESSDVNGVDALQAAESTESDVAASPQKEPDLTSEVPLEPETKSDEVDVDLSKLTLNEKDGSN